MVGEALAAEVVMDDVESVALVTVAGVVDVIVLESEDMDAAFGTGNVVELKMESVEEVLEIKEVDESVVKEYVIAVDAGKDVDTITEELVSLAEGERTDEEDETPVENAGALKVVVVFE